MEELICRPDEEREYFTEERCFILESWNDPRDPHVSIARARVEPGVTTRWHRLAGVTERYCILAGRGRVEIGDLPPGTFCLGTWRSSRPWRGSALPIPGRKTLFFSASVLPAFSQSFTRTWEMTG